MENHGGDERVDRFTVTESGTEEVSQYQIRS